MSNYAVSAASKRYLFKALLPKRTVTIVVNIYLDWMPRGSFGYAKRHRC